MPCGFICGFPTGGGGDLYGGNLYGNSAADKSGLQSIAQAAACRKWGVGTIGREEIPHAVCKGKYKPFDKNGDRMYGCFRHSAIRKKRIEKGGVRPEWVSFEQWQPRDDSCSL